VDFAIEPGSAAAGADFNGPGGSLTGTVTFMPGQATRSFTIQIVNDSVVEGPETVLLSLHNPTAGGLLGAQPTAVLTIVDRAGTVQFSKATATAQEFASSVTLTVTRTGPTGSAASVPYHLAGKTTAVNTALTPLDGTVSFAPGQGSVPLVIRLRNDSTQDGNAALTATLGTPLSGLLALGTPTLATVTLVDDEGTVQFAQPTFTVGEGSGTATIALTRTGGTTRSTTVHFATGGVEDSATPSVSAGFCSPGADYRKIVDRSLTFNPGETSRTFAVQLCGDGVVESPDPETLTLRLLGVSAPATMGAQSTAVLQIQDNDGNGTVRFSSESYSVTEGTSPATLTVLRANGAAGTVQVPWSLGGDASLNTDYGGPTSGQLEFVPGQMSASLSIPILNDTLVDGAKNLVVTLGAPTGGAALGSPSVATLAIKDNEPSVRFSSATYNVSESSAGVLVTVVRGGSTGGTVKVNVRTTDTGTAQGDAGPCAAGVDFTTSNPLVTFNPGETSKNVTIPLCRDTEVDGLETIGLALDNVLGATLGTPNTAAIQIAEDDVAGAAQFAAAASSVSESQSTANVLVTRSGGNASGLKIRWTVTGGTAVHGDTPGPGVDYTGPTFGVVVFELSEVSQSIPIPVWPRAGAQGPRSVTLVLDWAAGGGTLGARTTTTLWILDADLPDAD
jgi:Calx-beta domain-containing protein